jgi:methylated-DNA-[protein]-cysteine S-methyltransferase
MEGIYARESSYLERYVQVGVASDRLLRVTFPEDADAEPEHDVLDRIFAYLEGVEDDFGDVNVALTVPTAHREVLAAVREIPYGEQVGVESLATAAPALDPGSGEDVETVRAALAGNPAPLVIPDHRVRDGPSGAPPEVEQRLRSLEGIR